MHVDSVLGGDPPLDATPTFDAKNVAGTLTVSGVANGLGAGNGTHGIKDLRVKAVGSDGDQTTMTITASEFRNADGDIIADVTIVDATITLDLADPVPGLTTIGIGVVAAALAAAVLWQKRIRSRRLLNTS